MIKKANTIRVESLNPRSVISAQTQRVSGDQRQSRINEVRDGSSLNNNSIDFNFDEIVNNINPGTVNDKIKMPNINIRT